MWSLIGQQLQSEWTIEPAAWILKMVTEHQAPNEETSKKWSTIAETIRQNINQHHIKSPKVIPICMALAKIGDPISLQILEKIESTNPDSKAQGVAALGVAMSLQPLGDEPELIRRRLTYLRKAIIESSDIELENTTVAKLAENELYQIRYLSKGRVAPDISAKDANNQPIQLSDYKGKAVILIFWSSTIPEALRTIEITNDMVKKLQSKPVVVLGVCHDSLETLRSMKNDETVTWRNFSDPSNELAKQYRVGSWPKVYVLDENRKIHYSGTQGTFAELTAEALIEK